MRAFNDFLESKTELAYAVLRIVAGLLWSFHGVQKIFDVLTEHPAVFPSQMWFGGLIELVGGILIAAGALTRPAAFLASGTMAVAYIQFHWKGALGAKLLPAINGGEPALLYCFLFLFIACKGAGRASVDAAMSSRRADQR